MENKTIEERAKRANWGLHIDSFDMFNEETKNAILRFATEQDRIAREEERERCIKVITEILNDPSEYYSVDGCTHDEYVDEDKIREAIEEGCEG